MVTNCVVARKMKCRKTVFRLKKKLFSEHLTHKYWRKKAAQTCEFTSLSFKCVRKKLTTSLCPRCAAFIKGVDLFFAFPTLRSSGLAEYVDFTTARPPISSSSLTVRLHFAHRDSLQRPNKYSRGLELDSLLMRLLRIVHKGKYRRLSLICLFFYDSFSSNFCCFEIIFVLFICLLDEVLCRRNPLKNTEN